VRPRRRLELAVLATAAIFVVALALSFRPGRRPTAGGERDVPPAPDASGQATTLLEGFDFTESLHGKPMMRIRADRTVGYGPAAGLAPNLYAGEKVELTVYPDDGPPVTVHSERAEYDERTRQSRLSGNVRWLDKDGALIETEEILFRPRVRELSAPRRIRFTQGATEISAPSARYDLVERVVHFAGPVEGSGAGDARAGGALSRIRARQGLYRRDTGTIELESFQGGSAGGDRLAADTLVLQMAEQGGRPSWARATGSVQGVLAPDGEAPAPVAGPGKPAAAQPGPAVPGPRLRHYAGDVGTIRFDAGGKTKSVELEGAPAILTEADGRLTARRIEVGFENGRAVTAAATGEVRVDSTGKQASAARARLGFAPDGSVENTVLGGAVRVLADGRSGEAERAVELPAQDRWRLTGAKGKSARVESAGSKLSADTIEIDRARQVVTGEGHARAIFAPDADKKTRLTGFVGDPKRPTFGKADRIVLEDTSRQATLAGSASIWQEDSSLLADDIALSDAERTVRASGGVRTVMAPAAAKGQAAARPASVITARRLTYRDEDRTARFEGGVSVTRGGWRASGADSTAWLDKEGQVESVEISGDVKMSDRETGRSGSAQKALDSPHTGKTVLWGAPARVTDAGGNQVAGAILTIVDRGRSVEITAPEGGKTETIHRTQKD
jgi:LPS export ABC transporter protein LptC